MYRTVINLEFFKIPSISGFRNRNIDTRNRQYIAKAGCQWKKVKSTKKKKREREHRGKRGNMKKKTWSQSGRTKRSAYKFAVEFAFPSSGNFRSRPAFLYDHRISNLREISGAMLFQRFRGFPVLDFNGGAGRARKFFYLSLTLHRFSPFFLWAEFCAELSPFVFGSRRHRRKWCVSVPSKACHFRTKNPTRFHKSFPPLQR